MRPVAPLMSVVEEFGDRVDTRSAAQLAVWEPLFRGECARVGIPVDRVCQLQPDETLAQACGKSFCVNEAFRELLCQRYGGKLAYWFTRHGLRYGCREDPHRNEELIQQLWVNLLTGGLRNYDLKRPFANYLYVASRNLFISQVFRGHKFSPLDDRYEVAGPDSVLLEVEGRETGERLRQILQQLPRIQREVLESIMAGRSPSETAQSHGLTVKQVYMEVFQARRAVERELGL